MAKFVIECPYCGAYHEASTSFFSRKIIECSCGRLIDVKKHKMKTVVCPHCKNTVAYDQSRGTKANCPICKQPLVTSESLEKARTIHCPSCACELTVDKSASTYVCPLCETEIDVQEQLKKEAIKKEGLVSIIKYEGPNDVLIWKHPIEDFNFGSQLIVHESQEAIFFKDGKALDSFGSGRYTLETGSIPVFKALYKAPLDGKEPFHSEVYFVNLTTQMGVKWGTDSKIRMFDPVSGLHLEIGACGQFNICINNGRKLLLKVVGTTSGLQQQELVGSDYSAKAMTGKFKALVMTKVKSFLAKTIRENDINILEVDEHLDEISNLLKDKINAVLDDYGLEIPEFFVTTILTPDDDPNYRRMKEQYAERYLSVQQERIRKAEAQAAQERRLVEAQTLAQEELIAAQAKAQAYQLQAQAEASEMQMKGYTYQQETQRQVAKAAVENQPMGGGAPGTGDVTGMLNGMVNLGVGLGVMGEVVNTVKSAVNPAINPAVNAGKEMVESINGWVCPNCHKTVTTNFCPDCGTKRVEPTPSWDCSCGQKGITTNFCPNCGKKKGE